MLSLCLDRVSARHVRATVEEASWWSDQGRRAWGQKGLDLSLEPGSFSENALWELGHLNSPEDRDTYLIRCNFEMRCRCACRAL